VELELVDNDKVGVEDKEAHTKSESQYDGPDRRKIHRRHGHDRRAMVRFELDKTDRRQKEDRRNTANVWDKGHTLF
jgi:hypothetical protein